MPSIEVVLTQEYLGQEVYNVFHYYGTASISPTVAQLDEFLEEFELLVIPALNDIQVNGVTNTSLKVLELGNANIQTTSGLTGGGGATANGAFWLPRAQTYAYRLYVGQSYDLYTAALYTGNRYITHGYKRFTGVSDEFISSGTWDAANTAFIANSVALGDALTDTIATTSGGAQSWVPMVYGRAIEATDDLPARVALRAFVTTAALQSPAWTNRRK